MIFFNEVISSRQGLPRRLAVGAFCSSCMSRLAFNRPPFASNRLQKEMYACRAMRLPAYSQGES